MRIFVGWAAKPSNLQGTAMLGLAAQPTFELQRLPPCVRFTN